MKWVPELITILGYFTRLRFNEIQSHLNHISSTVLANRLKDLEDQHYLKRVEFAESPPRVEYSLTPKGVFIWETLQQLSNIE